MIFNFFQAVFDHASLKIQSHTKIHPLHPLTNLNYGLSLGPFIRFQRRLLSSDDAKCQISAQQQLDQPRRLILPRIHLESIPPTDRDKHGFSFRGAERYNLRADNVIREVLALAHQHIQAQPVEQFDRIRRSGQARALVPGLEAIQRTGEVVGEEVDALAGGVGLPGEADPLEAAFDRPGNNAGGHRTHLLTE